MAEQLTQNTSLYRQVKNPDPKFIPEEGKKTLPFCEKIRAKAAGFTRRMEFQTLVAMSIARGERKRRPPELRMRALEASLQALCHYFNPLANRVGASLTTMSIRCGLATEKKRLSITRFTGAVQFMAQLKLVTYNTEYDKEIGCNIPTDITFTPLMWQVLDVSEEAVTAARRSRIEWENRQREKRGLPRAGAEELISAAWAFVRERFREYQKSRREHGMKRHRARKDAPRTRKDIQQLVRLQIQKEIRNGRFFGGLDAVRAEIERRVTERMKLSRGHYARLADALLVTT
ncbi:plasmid replication initiator RepA [Pantoea dispersa]|uniref:Replication initiation protein n=1 Tax=Pantoea dispersa TaxID=59814 RepID=A0A8E1S089_9GAMM|nr:plasmid replication initiator RepA [Pantoea dispersa]KTR88258.1 replication initiation protein [Pantoea dispersa]KTR98669.1 replication initiation protein [Pantoea dispersa]KTS20657.1 replication initiation protein [Pantoea dispersa]KTS31089.1 replication initiation protein [Pantoea dispersa]KTS54185.1 replication initiation protein [Pantoea dispersa]